MIAIRSNGTATPGKTAGKNLPGGAINAMNTVSYQIDSKSAVDGYNLLTSQFAISGSNSIGDLWGYIWGYLRNSPQRNVSTINHLCCGFESCCRTQIGGIALTRRMDRTDRAASLIHKHCITIRGTLHNSCGVDR